jgi:hypothetical protein
LAQTGVRDTDVPLSDLAAVPTTVSVDGVPLVVETSLWRDFQPICPPDGYPLIAMVRVRTVGSTPLPANLTAERIALVRGDRAWVARPVRENPGNVDVPFEVVARNGPKWEPGITVEVILQFADSHLLRVPNQVIERTD